MSSRAVLLLCLLSVPCVAWPQSAGVGVMPTAEMKADIAPDGTLPTLLAASNPSSSNPASSTAPEENEALDLPVNARQWESLGLLSSYANSASGAEGANGDMQADIADGTRGEGVGAGSAASGLSYAGLAPAQNAATLDGLSMEQNFSSRTRGFSVRGSVQGGPVSGASFGQGAVRSFREMPGSYAAEFGGASSAVLAIDSRAAGAAWHGQAYATLRSSAMDAANPYSVVTRYRDGAVTNYLAKPEDTTVQFGGHVSVPLGAFLRSSHGKHGVTLFASWEEMLRDAPAISSPETSSFYALTATQIATLQNRGLQEAQWVGALNYLDSLTGTISRFSTRALAFIRVDEQASKRDHLVATYAHNRFRLPAGSGFRSQSDAVVNRGIASVGDAFVNVDAVAGHWAHAFTPRMENVVRAQFVRDFDFDRARSPLSQEPGIAPGGYAPEVDIEPEGFSYGTPANLGRAAYPEEHRIEVVETLQWLLRKNLITIGGDWNRIDDRIDSTTNVDGTFLYDSNASGLVDWITDYTFNVNMYPNGGCPSIGASTHDFCFRSFTQNFAANSETKFVTHTVAGYGQDAFHMRKGLSFNAGARYEYVLLPLPQQPNAALDESLRTLTLPVRGVTSSFPEDRNNVAARAAVSWSPRGGKWLTARVGYGWFYGRLPGTMVQAALADTALSTSTLATRIRPTTEASCPQGGAVPQQGFGYPCAFLAVPPGVVQQTSRAVIFSQGFRLPAVERADFSLERGWGKHVLLRGSYSMALATQLPSSVDINIASTASSETFTLAGGSGWKGLRDGETFVVPVYTQRRLPQYGPITAITSSANATYHAGTLEMELREWRGWSLRASYTFSKALDYAPLQSGAPKVNAQFDPFSNGYDKGLSSLDFPQRFAGDLVWRPSFQHGPRWIRRSVNGWRAAAIATAGSGAPYSYEISGGTYLNGGRESLNGSGGATYLPTVGRDTLRLASRGNVDLRLERVWSAKTVKLSGFVETFNLLNARNLTSVETRAFLLPSAGQSEMTVCPVLPPNTLVFQSVAAITCEGLNTPAFGQAMSSTSGTTRERQMEAGLRVQF